MGLFNSLHRFGTNRVHINYNAVCTPSCSGCFWESQTSPERLHFPIYPTSPSRSCPSRPRNADVGKRAAARPHVSSCVHDLVVHEPQPASFHHRPSDATAQRGTTRSEAPTQNRCVLIPRFDLLFLTSSPAHIT